MGEKLLFINTVLNINAIKKNLLEKSLLSFIIKGNLQFLLTKWKKVLLERF